MPFPGQKPMPGDSPGIPNQWDDYQYDPYVPEAPGAGAGGGCSDPNTFPATLDSGGNPKEPDGECIDAAESARRNAIRNQRDFPNEGKPKIPEVGGGPSAPSGPATYKFAPVPVFDAPEFVAPQFTWDEVFQAPSYTEAESDPGYRFRLEQGRKALEQSAAGRGKLRTGGTLKDILNYGQNAASQEYANVFDRYARGYDTRFGTAKDKFGFQYGGAKDEFDARYQGAKDEYSPKLFEWQTKTAFGTNAAMEAWKKAWDSYFRDTLSASDIFGAGR